MLEDAKMGDIDVGVFKEMFATGLHRILRIYGETKGNSALVGINFILSNDLAGLTNKEVSSTK